MLFGGRAVCCCANGRWSEGGGRDGLCRSCWVVGHWMLAYYMPYRMGPLVVLVRFKQSSRQQTQLIPSEHFVKVDFKGQF
jgi:hypothetical protein